MKQESYALKMPLTEEEQRDLARREEYIEENLQTLFSVGKAFADIRDRKLYRASHRTFEEYCHDRWKISRPRAYQLIDASVVHEIVSTNVDKNTPIPTNESQTRALKKAPKDKQPELWEKAVKSNNGNAPTARQIVHVYETEFTPKPANVKTVTANLENNGHLIINTPGGEHIDLDFNQKPKLTVENLKPRIKMFFQQEFPSITKARTALEILGNTWTWDLEEPYKSLTRRLREFIFIQYQSSTDVSIRDGCKAVSEDWKALADYREQMQAAREDAPPSDADVCPECLAEHGEHEPDCTHYEAKCAKCGVLLPDIEDEWSYEEKSYCWDCIKQFKPELAERERQEAVEPEPAQEKDKDICTYCHSVHTIENNLYYTGNGLTVCQDCIAKASAKFQLYNRDRDRIIKAGLRVFSCTKVYCTPRKYRIREYTNTHGQGGDWKDVENFETLTAMKAQVKKLEQEPNVIFDGRI